MTKNIILLLFIVLSSSTFAQEKDAAMAAQNPLASIISLPLQNNTNFGIGDSNRTANTLNIQPIYPITFSNSWVLINRAIIPIETFPDFSKSSGSITGLGDINYTAWFSPPGGGSLTWGFGLVSIWPTATDDILGSGKFSIGPSFVLVNMTEKLMLAAIISDWFSIAGDSERDDVNTFYLQYVATYFLPNKWYLTTGPINTANWKAESGQKWTIPVGGGFGKMFKWGNIPMDATAQVFYYAVKPDDGPDWQLRFQLKFIFPK
jgi:hypothetical protein